MGQYLQDIQDNDSVVTEAETLEASSTAGQCSHVFTSPKRRYRTRRQYGGQNFFSTSSIGLIQFDMTK